MRWLLPSLALAAGCAAGPASPPPLFDAHVHLNDEAMQLRLMDEHGVDRAVVLLAARAEVGRDVLRRLIGETR